MLSATSGENGARSKIVPFEAVRKSDDSFDKVSCHFAHVGQYTYTESYVRCKTPVPKEIFEN
jgi:hypothetical protein